MPRPMQTVLRILHPGSAAAAAWTLLAVLRARRALRTAGLDAHLPPPPRLARGRMRVVSAVLARTGATCLERATVLQAALAASGRPADVVIGVAGAGDSFAAHAWIERGGAAPEAARYREIYRLPSRAGR